MWIFFFLGGGGRHYELGPFFWGGGGVISIHFRAFKGQNTEWIYFWATQFQIFLGMPDIPDFFFFFFFFGGGGVGGKQKLLGPSLCMMKH